jgi:hypothetical protein
MYLRGIGYRYTFAGRIYEIVRSESLGEISSPSLQMTSPHHWVVRDEDGNESRVSDWFIDKLGIEVTPP